MSIKQIVKDAVMARIEVIMRLYRIKLFVEEALKYMEEYEPDDDTGKQRVEFLKQLGNEAKVTLERWESELWDKVATQIEAQLKQIATKIAEK